MRQPIYDESTIEKIRSERARGKSAMELAMKYNVHYRTIENYCKGNGVPKRSKDWLRKRFVSVM